MTPVFADTFYWVALADSRDVFHEIAVEVQHLLEGTPIVTTEEVLVEFLNSCARAGPFTRLAIAGWIEDMRVSEQIEIVEQSHATFELGREAYIRPDNSRLGMVDCISLAAMRERGITDVLSADESFGVAGIRPYFAR